MKTLIIYDSAYGNTEKIASAIQDALRPFGDVQLTLVKNAQQKDLVSSDIVFVGSPTQGGRPTEQVQAFIDNLPSDVLKNKLVAAFDTRFATNDHGLFLKIVMKTIGFASPKIARKLEKKGARLVQPAAGFIVEDTKGPLSNEELTKAFRWAQNTYTVANQKRAML